MSHILSSIFQNDILTNYIEAPELQVLRQVNRHYRHILPVPPSDPPSVFVVDRVKTVADLKLSFQQGFEVTYSSLSVIAGSGSSRSLEVLQHLHRLKLIKKPEFAYFKKIAESAARGGCLNIVQWAYANGTHADGYRFRLRCTASLQACYGGHLQVLQWVALQEKDQIHQIHCNWRHQEVAAEFGHIELLKFMYTNELWQKSERVCNYAAANGHLHILKWLDDQECPLIRCVSTHLSAASNGQLEILEWLYEEGCPEHSRSISEANMEGHLEVVKYLEAQNY
jgi:hypothetical protein